MRQETIIIGISIFIISIVIYVIKNQAFFVENIKNKKWKFFIAISVLFLLAFLVYYAYINVKEIMSSIKIYYNIEEEKELYEYSDNKKLEENLYYKDIYSKEYKEKNYENPYIPDGFKYVEGTYLDGFVIEDENKNQYVWVPCTNKNINGISKLEKKNFTYPVYVSKDFCYDENYEKFLESALENGGFYISRFEIGKENDLPVSKLGVEVWKDVTREDAKNIISKMYNEKNINCEMINGFAYDTTLTWINMHNKIENHIVNIEKENNIYTGRNVYNNIYDFCDNMLEFTTENFYDNIIVRGFSASKENMNLDVKFTNQSRYTIFKENTTVSYLDGLCFRTIIYK